MLLYLRTRPRTKEKLGPCSVSVSVCLSFSNQPVEPEEECQRLGHPTEPNEISLFICQRAVPPDLPTSFERGDRPQRWPDKRYAHALRDRPSHREAAFLIKACVKISIRTEIWTSIHHDHSDEATKGKVQQNRQSETY